MVGMLFGPLQFNPGVYKQGNIAKDSEPPY